MSLHMLHMAAMGLLVSVAAPLIVSALVRAAPGLDRWALPAGAAFPGFVVLHAVVTVHGGHGPVPLVLDALAHLMLLIGALFFWAPVLGFRHRLPEGVRAVYLYAAMPMLDLAGVWMVAIGDIAGGLAMIVGMLPMGVAAAAITWRWICDEERRAVLAEASAMPAAPGAHTTERSS